MKNKTADQIHPNQSDIFDFLNDDKNIHSESIITDRKYKLISYDIPFFHRLPTTAPFEIEYFESFEVAYKYAMTQEDRDIEIVHVEYGLLASFHV